MCGIERRGSPTPETNSSSSAPGWKKPAQKVEMGTAAARGRGLVAPANFRHTPRHVRTSPPQHGRRPPQRSGLFLRLVAVRKDLAVRGFEGEIKHGGKTNSYYNDLHDATVHFDFDLGNGSYN